MPELPEVETICRGLAQALTGAKILQLDQRRKTLRFPLPPDLPKRVQGRIILSVSRRAKYILIHLDKKETLILHLGMSGRLVIRRESVKPASHDHLVFHCDNGLTVTFNDPRRFGLCDLVSTAQLDQHKLFNHLGAEPFDQKFNTAYLADKLRNKKTAIKIAIMNQEIVVGVGNIYASEALFYAGIKPSRAAGKVTRDEVQKLVGTIRKVLKAAIRAGGSSLRDYVSAEGELGYFQNHHAVYGREGSACKECFCDPVKTGGVKRIIQGGRSSFYCPQKQK